MVALLDGNRCVVWVGHGEPLLITEFVDPNERDTHDRQYESFRLTADTTAVLVDRG